LLRPTDVPAENGAEKKVVCEKCTIDKKKLRRTATLRGITPRRLGRDAFFIWPKEKGGGAGRKNWAAGRECRMRNRDDQEKKFFFKEKRLKEGRRPLSVRADGSKETLAYPTSHLGKSDVGDAYVRREK